MICVKNNYVKMNWDVEGFITHKDVGFLCAMAKFGDVVVVFEEGAVYTMKDDEGYYTMKDIEKLIKESWGLKRGKNENIQRQFTMDEFTEYFPISDGGEVYKENAKLLGLTDDNIKEIELRMADLEPYFREVIEDA